MRKPGCLGAIIVLGIVLVVALLFGLRAGLGVVTEGIDYEKERAAAEAAGIPTHMAELARPLPPPAQNAAIVYAELTQRFAAKHLSPADRDSELGGMNLPAPGDWAKARTALARRLDLLRLTHEAARRPQCVFDRDWGMANPALLRFPEYATIRDCARRLTAESLLMAHDGKGGLQAVRNETLGFTIARHGASDPTLFAWLVGLACDEITLNGLRKIVYVSNGDPKVAAAVRDAIDTHWRSRSLVPPLRGEIAEGQSIADYVRQPSRMSPTPMRVFMFDIDAAHMLRYERKQMAYADLPYIKAEPPLIALARPERGDKSPFHSLSQILLPMANEIVHKKAEGEAWAIVTRTGAALVAWKGTHGAFPATLGEALPTVPNDPFDSKPLRYRREGAGFVVYSIGPTEHFAGGTLTKRPDTSEPVFRWPPPPYLRAKRGTPSRPSPKGRGRPN